MKPHASKTLSSVDVGSGLAVAGISVVTSHPVAVYSGSVASGELRRMVRKSRFYLMGAGILAKITLRGKLTKIKRGTEHHYSGHVAKVTLKGKLTKEKRYRKVSRKPRSSSRPTNKTKDVKHYNRWNEQGSNLRLDAAPIALPRQDQALNH